MPALEIISDMFFYAESIDRDCSEKKTSDSWPGVSAVAAASVTLNEVLDSMNNRVMMDAML